MTDASPDAAAEGSSTREASSTPVATAVSPVVLRYCDFRDFIQHLAIDPVADGSGLVMVAAHQMFAAALPPQWTEQVDGASARVYFFKQDSGESLWMHPHATLFKELIEEVRSWRPDEPAEAIFARSDGHLRRAHRRAVEVISQWSAFDLPEGPEEAPETGDVSRPTQFYFNSSTGESSWTDPRETVECDLRQRHSILCECIAAHTQGLSRLHSPSDSSAEENENEEDFVKNLRQLLGQLPLPLGRSESTPPNIAAAPRQEIRPSHLPAGDDTSRSCMSYLTARSTSS